MARVRAYTKSTRHNRRISRWLKTDGELLIAVPNYKSWDAKHYKEHWAAYDVPRHLHHFDKNSMSMLKSTQFRNN